MHWLLRLAILLNTILAVTLSGMFAITAEEQFPSSADAEITISASTHGDARTLSALADDHELVLAQVTHAAEDGQSHRIISLLPGAESAAAPQLDKQYPDYGFRADTAVEYIDVDTDSPLGAWVVYGAEDNFDEFTAAVIDAGFTVFDAGTIGVSRYVSDYFSNPLWMLQAAGLAILFVAALVSTQSMTRVRAVKFLHGQAPGRAIAGEVCKYVLYTLNVAAAGWIAWAGVGWLKWDAAQTFGYAGAVFTCFLLFAVLASVLVQALGVGINATAVSGLLDQVKGRRPLGMTYWATVATLLITLTGAFVSLGYAQSTATYLTTSQENTQRLQNAPDGYTVALWGTDEAAVHNVLPQWRSFIDEQETEENLVLTSYEEHCSLFSMMHACLILNHTAAKDLGVEVPNEDSVALLAPESVQRELPQLTESVQQRLQMEEELDEAAGITPEVLSVEDIEPRTRPEGSAIDLHTTGPSEPSTGTVIDPIIIVAPAQAFSANTHYSWASLGSSLFLAESPEDLLDSLREHQAQDLVGWVERPSDAAEAAVAEATQYLAQFTITAAVTLSGVLILGILLAIVYCEHRRRPLFVQHVHGASLTQRYGPYFALVISVSLLALWLSPGADAAGTGMRFGAMALLLTGGALSLFIRDRTLRASTIKHP